jgi:putative copper resistance protein D
LVPERLAVDVERHLRRAGAVAIALAVATTVAVLPIETAEIGDGWSAALDPATIGGILATTTIGTPWLIQAVAAVALVAASIFSRRNRSAAIAFASAFVLVSLAFTGHAVMQQDAVGVAHRLNDAVHVLCAAAWLGGLVPLLLVLRRFDCPEYRREAHLALGRFSTAGHVIMPLILVSGVINTALVLGRWPIDWSSPYQALLAAKIAVVVTMIALATANRYVFMPRFVADRAHALVAMRRATIAEVALAYAAVALVSVFGIFDPV